MLFSSLFIPSRVSDAVSERAWLQAMLDAESALAEAQARAGLISREAADEIAVWCRVEHFDVQEIGLEARETGNMAEPLVRALRRRLADEAARQVHCGATSQDILDTAAMLVTRRTLVFIEDDVTRVALACASLAEAHRTTFMVGRTLLQHALPTTFGLKAACWLEGVTRAMAGLRRVNDESLAAELGGAVGTLASMGEAGTEVLRIFAEVLGLAEPVLPWHTERTRVAEIGGALAVVAGALDKTALDVVLLAQTEVGEVSEGGAGTRGGSSTMPHKRNPVGATLTRACARQAQSHAEILVRGMAGEHERSAGAWHAEWQALTGALAFTGGAAAGIAEVLEHLQVFPERMWSNLDATHGLVMSERVALLLAERIGREQAHGLIRSIGSQATGPGGLEQALLADPVVLAHLSPEEIERAMDPVTYLGSAQAFIDRTLAHSRRYFTVSGAGDVAGGTGDAPG